MLLMSGFVCFTALLLCCIVICRFVMFMLEAVLDYGPGFDFGCCCWFKLVVCFIILVV